MPSRRSVPLPRGRTRHVESSLLHAISLALLALKVARSCEARPRFWAQLDQAEEQIALLKEELAIKDARWGRVPSRRRPHFTPVNCLGIQQVGCIPGVSAS